MSRLDLLSHLALVPQDVPDVMDAGESLKRIYVRHFPDDGGLAVVELSPEEDDQLAAIVTSMSSEGSLAVFDASRLLGVVTFLASHPELLSAVFKLFKKA